MSTCLCTHSYHDEIFNFTVVERKAVKLHLSDTVFFSAIDQNVFGMTEKN